MRLRGARVFVTSSAQRPSVLARRSYDAPRTKMTRDRLTPHFAAAEFDCRDGVRWPEAARPAIVALCRYLLEPMREEFGPIRVTSGFRHTAYNRAVGGAAQSFHVYTLRYGTRALSSLGKGVAADVVPARGTPLQWQKWARSNLSPLRAAIGGGRGAAVAYPASGFVHVDSGPTRTWAG